MNKKLILYVTLLAIIFVACGTSKQNEGGNNVSSPDKRQITTKGEEEKSSNEDVKNEDVKNEDVNQDKNNLLSVLKKDYVTDNYYFELHMDTNDIDEKILKIWSMGESLKIEDDNMITYINAPNGKSGVYTKAANTMTVTPNIEELDYATPFTLLSEIEEDTYDSANYVKDSNLDGKDVAEFTYNTLDMSATYYVWKDKGIIIKMDSKVGDMTASYYFKDIMLEGVVEDDFNFPQDAQMFDPMNINMPNISNN